MDDELIRLHLDSGEMRFCDGGIIVGSSSLRCSRTALTPSVSISTAGTRDILMDVDVADRVSDELMFSFVRQGSPVA